MRHNEQIELIDSTPLGLFSAREEEGAATIMPIGPQHQCLHCGKLCYDVFCSPACRLNRKQFLEGLARMPQPHESDKWDFEKWLGACRFFRSGKFKNAELPNGETVILTRDNTAKYFRVQSRDYLRHLWQRRRPIGCLSPTEAKAIRETKQAEEEAGRGEREIERGHRQLDQHGGKCLQCGRKSESMFCAATCRNKWKSSMNAFSRRLERTKCADGEAVDLF